MTDTTKKRKEDDKIDEELEESFPASDPPSFNPGHAGEPVPSKEEKDKENKK